MASRRQTISPPLGTTRSTTSSRRLAPRTGTRESRSGADGMPLGFRFLAAARWDDEWRESLADHGTAPPPERRFRQETALLGFFVSSLSVLESFCYAAFASAALVRPDDLRGSPRSGSTEAHHTRDHPGSTRDAVPRLFACGEHHRDADVQRVRTDRRHPKRPGAPVATATDAIPRARRRGGPPSVWQLEIHGFESLELSPDVTAIPASLAWYHAGWPDAGPGRVPADRAS